MFVARVLTILGHSFVLPDYVQQLLLAALLGLSLGTERAYRRKAASVRTFSMICAGSCLFSLLSVQVAGHPLEGQYDPTRVAAGIVTGIGFVGGGVIFLSDRRVQGISTASMIWLAAGIGMACGFNRIDVALWSFVVYWFIIVASVVLHKMFGARVPKVQVVTRAEHPSSQSDDVH